MPSTDYLNVVLNFHQADQFSARILLELLMALEEGIETHYYLQYGDRESTLEIQETLSRFCSQKTATLSTTLPNISIPPEWIETDPNQHSYAGNHTCKNSIQKQKIFQWNLSIFKYIHQLDHFLAIEPDCLFLKQQWAQPIYQAFLDRKQPIIGHLKQGTLDHQRVPTHFAGCSVYDGLALRQLPLERYFSERYENPWWSLRDRPGTTTANNAFVGPVFSGYDVSYDYFLYALYLRELTGSNNPLDWTNQCLESREDLIVCDFRSRLTTEEILEQYYGKVPLLHGVKDDAARQVVLRMVQSQELADRPLYPIGGQFAAPAVDRQRPVDQPAETSQALNVLRPDNSGLLSIADLRGQFTGKRCFIIGNGPSLKKTDLSRLQHEFTFGLNRIYLNYEAMGFEPTFYCCVNPNVTEQFAEEIDRLNSVKFVTDRARDNLKNHWNTFFMQSIPKIGFNENLNDLAWHEGWTVTYCAMQVAFHLGFEEVILLGVDHYFKESGEPNKAVTATGPDANHFHPEYFGKGVVWQYPDLERSEQSYRIAKEVYEKHDRRILDATIGGHLQIFPKVNFDELADLTAQPRSPEQQEKALLKRHPYPFAIFLPTEKIPYPQRVEGLQRVVEIYETRYESIYRPQLQALRDQCKGKKRAFVIGNGPSLNQTDLSLLKDEITFGVNGIFLKFQDTEFRPTFYVVEDHLVAEDRQEAINQLRGPIKLFPAYLAYCLNEADDTVFYNHVPRRSYPDGFDFSTDASDRTYTGCTVTFSCLQLAYYFGFQEIYLIGVDCDYDIPQDVEEKKEYSVTTLDMKSDDKNHFHPDYFGKGFRWHDPQVDKMRDAYAEARKVCEANGVTIYNATIGGKLEVFPRVDYYSLFSEPPATSRLLIIDLTRIGENTATGQMKQALFQDWPQEDLLQVHITGHQRLGLYSPTAEQPVEHYTDTNALLDACVRFAPNVIYYRPVADHPYLHTFACAAIDRLSAATVIHIVDDWPQRLQQQNPDLYSEFDRSLRSLFYRASACLSICSAMSTAFQARYGVEFIPIANCIDPVDWTSLQTNRTSRTSQTDRPFTIRYVGSLAADMTLESVLDVAKAVAALQSEVAVQLEIYTLKLWKDKVAEVFAQLPGVSIHESGRSLPEYRQLLMEADALLIAYNFDPESIAYVRYSMANKFPECLASATPVLVYGPIDVATVAYAAEIGCTQLVLERDPEKLKTTIRDLIADPTYTRMLGKVAQKYAFEHHAVAQVRTQFHKILHNATTTKPVLRLQQPIPTPPIAALPSNNGHSHTQPHLTAATSNLLQPRPASLAANSLSDEKTAIIGPKVSIIMPAYNAAETILESIQSIQKQDYQNWELLVINDFSRDDTATVVQQAQAQDDRIQLHDNEGIGTSAARNTGLDRATGEFITFLDADDILYEGALTKRVAALQAHPEWSVVSCVAYLSDGNFQPLGREIRIGKLMFTFTDSYRNLHPNSLMGRATVMKRFEFDGEHDGVEDWVYLSRLLRSGYCVFEVNDCAVAYRLRDNSVVTADFKTHEDRCLKVLDLLYGTDPKCPDAKAEFANGLTLPPKPIVIANRQIGLLTQLILRRQHRSISRLVNEMDLAVVETLSDEEITDQIEIATIRTCYCHKSAWQTTLSTQQEIIRTVCQRGNIYQLLPHYTTRLFQLCGMNLQQLPPIPESSSMTRRKHRFSRVVLGQFSREQGIHIDETQVIAHLMSDLPQSSIMVDVGAHHGTALNSFAEKGWRVFAYEPDPDNRQILTQRVKNRSNVTIDNRAVSDRAGNTLTLYTSQESTGISTLTPFRDSHTQRCQVMTTTVAQICAEHQLNQIDFLKIDTEGYDLMVLKGVPWEQIQPQVIECEFEDSKTVPLGYTFHDLAQYLVDKGYTVLVSEWHPVIRYGIQHDWYRLITYPCQLATPQAWGNLLAFKHPPELDRVATVAQSLVKAKAAKLSTSAPKHDAMTHQTPAIEGRNGMNSTPLKVSTDAQLLASQSSHSQLNSAQNGHSSSVAVQPDEKSSMANSTPPSPQPTRLATGLLRRISRYYSRWPLGVAVLAAALNTAAMIDELPFRWAFSGSGTLLLLFLVGHAASKADVSLEVGDRAQTLADQAEQKATSAFNRGTRAGERAKKALQTANQSTSTAKSVLETVDQVSGLVNDTTAMARSALETANYASGRTEVALEAANRASSTAKLATETANQSLGRANVALGTAEQATEKTTAVSKQLEEIANQVPPELLQLKRANSLNVSLFQPFDRQLSPENLEILMQTWLPLLNLTLDRRALGYLAHRICLCEDACSGRLATSVQDMLLRLLVARSVTNQNLSVLEIGSLFGINLATIYDTCRSHFDTIHLSAIDPLAGYYDKSASDMITQVPVTRKIFEHNLRQIDVPVQDVTLIQGLSTEEVVLEKAGLRQYNLLIIDGDHSYTGVKFDFDHYASAVDLGGYILFDDYGTKDWPEVTAFVDQEVKSNPCVEFVGASWRTAVFKVVRRNLV